MPFFIATDCLTVETWSSIVIRSRSTINQSLAWSDFNNQVALWISIEVRSGDLNKTIISLFSEYIKEERDTCTNQTHETCKWGHHCSWTQVTIHTTVPDIGQFQVSSTSRLDSNALIVISDYLPQWFTELYGEGKPEETWEIRGQ